MPAITHRPSRLNFYPDWSTLVYAFDGLALAAPPANRELLHLVHDVAREANLCLSLVHLLELLRGERASERIDRARWLDTLEVVWLRDLDEVEELELERLLRRAANLGDESHFLPAAPSFLAAFREWTPSLLAQVLLDASVTRWIEEVGRSKTIRDSLESFSSLGPNTNRRLFYDRKLAERDEVSTDDLRAGLKGKVDHGLLQHALEVNRSLAARDATYRIKKGSLWVAPDEAFVRAAMRPLDEIRDDIPSAFAFHEVIRNVGVQVAQKEHAGTKFFRSGDRKGDPFDWWHLIGAAYCDVFVCDNYTSKCLGSVREHLGRPRALVRRGDLSEFVRELREALQF